MEKNKIINFTDYVRTLFSIIFTIIPYTIYCILISFILYTFPFIPFADASIITKPTNNLGLVGYWNFNEGTSTYAGDFSANNNAGVLTNMANPPTATSGWGNGKFGNGLNFDGVNDHILKTISDYQGGDNVGTISVWFKTSSLTNALTIVGSSDTASTIRYLFLGVNQVGSTGSVYVQNSNNSGITNQVRTTATTFNDGKWHHAVLVSNGTAWSIYVDGVNQPLTVGGGSNTGDWFADSTGRDNLTIGNLIRTSAISHVPGAIDDVRIYNRALSATEVSALYNTGATRFASSQALTKGTTLANGLVGHWTFDGKDTTNTTATDLSGQGNTGTFTNFTRSTNAVAGKLGQGMNFDGVDDGVNIGNRSIIDGASEASICFWLYYRPASVTIDSGLVTKWGSPTADGWLIWVDDVAGVSGRTNTIAFAVNANILGPGRVEGSSNLVTSGKWDHYCGTFKGSSFIRLYKNAVLDMESTIAPATVLSQSNPIYIGNSSHPSSIKTVDGTLDDVRIYNRALSASEIKQLYNLSASKMQASSATLTQGTTLANGLVGHWTFDGKDTTNATATDISGQGNNGTFTNFTRSTNAVAGKLGQGMNFDGVDDYISVGGVPLPRNDFTYSLWTKLDTNNDEMLAMTSDGGGLNEFYIWVTSAKLSVAVNNAILSNSTASISTGVWTHITVARSGSTVGYYINGVLDSSRSGSGTLNFGGCQLLLGTDTDGGCASALGNWLDGQLDDVRIYNRALSATEIRQLYLIGR